MEPVARTHYQGVTNIIRFNWHFYVGAGICVLLILLASTYAENSILWLLLTVAFGITASTCISLLVSHYVYDRSNLYDFAWLNQFDNPKRVVNVHAGFDETSCILSKHFPSADLSVFDFYDPRKHTEVSIERARKAYAAHNGTIKINTSALPVPGKSVNIIFNIFALHEVRNRNERINFLKDQCRTLADDGKLVVVEHFRDVHNFLAYNIGFFHFLSEKEWCSNFEQAGLCIYNRLKVTAFIDVLILEKADGNTR